MNKSIRQFIHDWVPPMAIRVIRSVLAAVRPAAFEFISYEWPKNIQLKGWQANSVADVRNKAWGKFLCSMEGKLPFGISEDDFLSPRHMKMDAQNLYLSYGYCLGLACYDKQVLKVLDWGGATADYYVVSKKMMPAIRFEYSCAELPLVCVVGQKLLPEVTFYDTDTWQNMHFDFVFSSSALQYLEDWRTTVRALIQSSNQYLYITRMPFVITGRSFVMLQRVKEYGTEYLGWVINRHEFLQFVEQHGMKLIREFVNHLGPQIKGAPEQNIYMGFLFEKQEHK